MKQDAETITVDCRRHPWRLLANREGTALVEFAIALPILISLLLGILTYGCWFMAAHGLQQAANDAARAAIAGIDARERRDLVDQSIAHTPGGAMIEPDLLTVTTTQDGRYYTVSLTYEVAQARLLSHSLIPLPSATIHRAAVVQLNAP
jgi:Flp pilus assembly protein TadG